MSKNHYAVLKIVVEDPKVKDLYISHIEKNNLAFDNELFTDSGFDIFVPEATIMGEKMYKTVMIDHKIKVEMWYYSNSCSEPEITGFFLFPRSSISKTPLMLANHTGIIDSGYRGNIIGAFRCFENDYKVEAGTRLLQICHPSLCRIKAVLVTPEELTITKRGTGGFGSTG